MREREWEREQWGRKGEQEGREVMKESLWRDNLKAFNQQFCHTIASSAHSSCVLMFCCMVDYYSVCYSMCFVLIWKALHMNDHYVELYQICPYIEADTSLIDSVCLNNSKSSWSLPLGCSLSVAVSLPLSGLHSLTVWKIMMCSSYWGEILCLKL